MTTYDCRVVFARPHKAFEVVQAFGRLTGSHDDSDPKFMTEAIYALTGGTNPDAEMVEIGGLLDSDTIKNEAIDVEELAKDMKCILERLKNELDGGQ